jgi:hypothetical protein
MDRLTLTEPGMKRQLKHKRNQLKKYFKNCPSALAYIELLENAYGDCALGWYYKQTKIPFTSTIPYVDISTANNIVTNNSWSHTSIYNGSIPANTTMALTVQMVTLPSDGVFTVFLISGNLLTSNPTNTSVPNPWTSVSYSGGDYIFIHFGTGYYGINNGSIYYQGYGQTPILIAENFSSAVVTPGMTISFRRQHPFTAFEIAVNGVVQSLASIPTTIFPNYTATSFTVAVGTKGGQAFRAKIV